MLTMLPEAGGLNSIIGYSIRSTNRSRCVTRPSLRSTGSPFHRRAPSPLAHHAVPLSMVAFLTLTWSEAVRGIPEKKRLPCRDPKDCEAEQQDKCLQDEPNLV